MTDNTLYKIALTLIDGVGDVSAKNLVSYCGGVEEVFQASKKELSKVPGIGAKVVQAIIKRDYFNRAETELKFVEKNKIKVLFYFDPEYPKRLLNCPDSPALLYYKGNADLNRQRIVSIVGTRKATEYGKYITDKIIKDLKIYDPVIVSGLAYGIDYQAHKSTVNEVMITIGAVGHSLDRIYPAIHRDLALKMIENGGLISEFPSGTKPDRENFPRRNRIVAGMADATILVESDIKGGAMITGHLADSYNRDVFAVPGRITDKYSSGCIHLIHTNKAAIYKDAETFAFLMGWADYQVKPKPQRELLVELNEDERLILNLFQEREEWMIDEVVHQLNLNTSRIAALLLELEFKGVIKNLPGKKFTLI